MLDQMNTPVPMTQARYPFYPLDMPGMPVPGADFTEAAVALGDKRPKIIINPDGTKTVDEVGPRLEQLYYDALYTPGFNIKTKVKGRNVPAVYFRGHLWGYKVTGPRPAKVMIVGKWPATDEVQMGRNLVGPPGQITIRAIEAAGITEDEYKLWYVTNLIKHPNLDPAGDGAPAAWVKNNLPILEEELRLVRPDFVLALGADAAKALIDKSIKVDSAHGQVFTRRVQINKPGQPAAFHDVQVMACIHPGRVVRTADKLPEFVTTIKRFAALIHGIDLSQMDEKPDHRVIYSEYELEQLVDDVLEEAKYEKDPQIIAIDCEWHGEYPIVKDAWLRTIQLSHKPGFAACVVLRECGGDYAFVPSRPCDSIEEAITRQLRRLLVNTPKRKVRIAGHNLRADLPWVYHQLDKQLGSALIKQFNGPDTAEETRTAGGFDTMLAAHAVTESPGDMGFKLEVLALNVCAIRRYDLALQLWKVAYCKEQGIKESGLDGYGMCPNDVLHPYACWDADATRRLVEAYNRPGGLLDKDQYGNSSRQPFWVSMRACPGFLEMEMTGIVIDRKRGDNLTDMFIEARDELTHKLRDMINWDKPGPEDKGKWSAFNPSSVQHCRTLLFGPEYAGKIDKESGEWLNVAPPDAMLLKLQPVKTSGKPSKAWERVVSRNQQDMYYPSTDKEVLGILVTKTMKEKKEVSDVVQTLRYIRFGGQVLRSMLREPLLDPVSKLPWVDDDGNRSYEKGLMAYVMPDDRVRTHLFQTKETGRASSARPPLQNLSKRREKDYAAILGPARYKYPLRSVVQATPGYVLVESDYMGAELFMMAVQAGDQAMIDHCLRANFPEGDPRNYDIHSNVAVGAFRLKVNDYIPDPKDGRTCAELLKLRIGDPLPATKKGLSYGGYDNLRTAAKTIAFGIPYGRGNAAVIRAVEEEGVFLTEDDADKIREAIFATYPELPYYLDRCKERVLRPGWMCNCKGRYRRFQQTGLDDGGEMQRQACNFPIQSGVADCVSESLYWLYTHPDRYTKDGLERYRMILQIHDAILFEVRIEDLEWFIGEDNKPETGLLYECMTTKVPVYSCDLDGKRMSDQQYFMGTESKVMLNWGVDLLLEEGLPLGVPERFCKKPKKK